MKTVIILLLITITSQAQIFKSKEKRDGFVSVGYAANIPNQLLGFNLVLAKESSLGVYLDYKLDVNKIAGSAEKYDGVTREIAEGLFGDRYLGTSFETKNINFAITYGLSTKMALYAGLGYSSASAFREYKDDNFSLSKNGIYWIPNPLENEGQPSALVGVLYKYNEFLLQLGYEDVPRGVTVGVGLIVF